MIEANLLIHRSLETHKTSAVWLTSDINTTSDHYETLYNEWMKHLNAPLYDIRAYVHVYKAQITPQNIPYTYDIGAAGGYYRVWNFGYSEAAVNKAFAYLRQRFDVVRIDRYDITLLDWEPPAPFRRVETPEWIKVGQAVS